MTYVIKGTCETLCLTSKWMKINIIVGLTLTNFVYFHVCLLIPVNFFLSKKCLVINFIEFLKIINQCN